ncbi:MAG: RNA methyltransferase [Crocinitomicaceae bacterium]|nr:RNA methyltransferase [Crocinitomicaceae bacterium]
MNRKLKLQELGRLSVDEYRTAEKTPLVIILDNIRSLNNIGSVFRTADCFRVSKIYLCGITATPPHRDIHKTAIGATESVDWEYVDSTLDLVRKLQDEGWQCYAIEQVENSISLEKFEPGTNTAIIFGNEVDGVQQEVIDQCDGCIEVPQFGTKHSLNISVCTGIVVWDLYAKMKL